MVNYSLLKNLICIGAWLWEIVMFPIHGEASNQRFDNQRENHATIQHFCETVYDDMRVCMAVRLPAERITGGFRRTGQCRVGCGSPAR